MNAPCHNCKERYLGCHSVCYEYQAYQAERRRISRDRFKQGMVDTHFITEAQKKKKQWKK